MSAAEHQPSPPSQVQELKEEAERLAWEIASLPAFHESIRGKQSFAAQLPDNATKSDGILRTIENNPGETTSPADHYSGDDFDGYEPVHSRLRSNYGEFSNSNVSDEKRNVVHISKLCLPPFALQEMFQRSVMQSATTSFQDAVLSLHESKNPFFATEMASALGIPRLNMLCGTGDKHRKPEEWINLRDSQNRRWANELVLKGVVFTKDKNIEMACKCYDEAINLCPTHADAWCAKGAALANASKFEKAIQCLQKALQIDPSHGNAQKYLNATKQKIADITQRAAPSSDSRNSTRSQQASMDLSYLPEEDDADCSQPKRSSGHHKRKHKHKHKHHKHSRAGSDERHYTNSRHRHKSSGKSKHKHKSSRHGRSRSRSRSPTTSTSD